MGDDPTNVIALFLFIDLFRVDAVKERLREKKWTLDECSYSWNIFK